MIFTIGVIIGFLLGLLERKVDKVSLRPQTIVRRLAGRGRSEVLITPEPEEHRKQEDKEFYTQL